MIRIGATANKFRENIDCVIGTSSETHFKQVIIRKKQNVEAILMKIPNKGCASLPAAVGVAPAGVFPTDTGNLEPEAVSFIKFSQYGLLNPDAVAQGFRDFD